MPLLFGNTASSGLELGTIGSPATSAVQLYDAGYRTDGLYYINLPTAGVTQVYCDLNTAGGGWMHISTFSDNNEAYGNTNSSSQQSGGSHPWAAPLYAPQNTGIWQDTSTLGSQSFTADFKNAVWAYYPMTQMLMKDSGASLRNLFYTNAISSQTMSAFWAARSWAANGSEVSNSAYSAGRVYGLGITNFGVSDPLFNSGSKSIMLFKFGEFDGTQDGNKDRTMIASHPHNESQNVDGPSGIGCHTSFGTTQNWRDIVPLSSAYPDGPPNSISGAPYNYTMWVR